MDRRRLLFAAVAVGGLALASGVRADVIRRTQNARSAGFQDWLPDGSMLITTRFGQTSQLHHVAGPGQERFQLTFFDEPIGGAAAQPGSDNRYLFTRDVVNALSPLLTGTPAVRIYDTV